MRAIADCSWCPSPNARDACGSSAQGARPSASNRTMSRTRSSAPATTVREMQAEYRFDYGQSRSNRFAERMGKQTVTVVLDPDVAAVFTTSESVSYTHLRAH